MARQYKRKGARKARVYKKKTGMSKTNVEEICKSIIARNTEQKIANFPFPPNTTLSCYGGSIWVGTGVWALSPYGSMLDMTNGLAQNQRVGNEFLVKNAVANLMFVQKPYDVTLNPTPQPLIITIYLMYQKGYPTEIPTALNGFFQNGSVDQSPSTTGAIYDTMLQINRDRWVVKKKIVRKLGYAEYAGTGVNNAAQRYTNNDFSLVQKVSFDYTKHLVKRVKYNDTTTVPTSRGLYMAILVSSATGGVLSNTQQLVTMNGNLQMKYTDS